MTPDPRSIIAAVAADHGLTLAELTGRDRRYELADARSEAAGRLWVETDLTLEAIGNLLGHRDHSTVSYLVTRRGLRSTR